MNHIPATHHRFTTIPDIIRIADCIKTQTKYINFLGYGGIYDTGMNFHLTTNKDWAEYYYSKYLFNPSIVKKRLKPGINYWKNNKGDDLRLIEEDARDNFDIDAWIEFTFRDEINKCYRIYAFTSNKKYADKAYRFYDVHRAKLLKFISYFNQEAARLIFEAETPENLVEIPKFRAPEDLIISRSYATELRQENANTELKDREFEIMLLYANGCTDRQIAEMLHRSQNTISTYLRNIRDKTGCHDKRSLHRYVVEHGWGGLEQFFFPYINA
ncbi:response regulator transcription factor [Cysteiniphilum litorale]|uniref:response regulator transcription factor n=2 Tax=Cysteiniphilum litorale TaxID=2056700 RepID=UPI003F884FEB